AAARAARPAKAMRAAPPRSRRWPPPAAAPSRQACPRSSSRRNGLADQIEPADFLVAQIDVESAQTIVLFRDRSRTNERVDLQRLVQHPRQGNLAQRGAFALRELVG